MGNEFTSGLDLVRKIKPVSWTYNEEACESQGVDSIKDFSRIFFGVIAQELAELLPMKKYSAVAMDDKENLMVDYVQLISPLISAVQEIATRLETLEEKINDISIKNT